MLSVQRLTSATAALVLFLVVAFRSVGAQDFHPNPKSFICAACIEDQVSHAAKAGGIKVRVSHGTFHGSGAAVTVSWSDVPKPQISDWIALYGANDNPKTTAPIKFIFANRTRTYLSTGAGSYDFILTNTRTDLVFAFLRGGLTTPVLMARSSVIRNLYVEQPHHVHLVYSGDPTEMTVVWASGKSTNELSSALSAESSKGYFDDHRVWYYSNNVAVEEHADSIQSSVPHRHSSSSIGITRSVPATTNPAFTQAMMCGSPASTTGYRDPGLLHVAHLTDLVPGQKYTYYCGNNATGTKTPEFTFRAAPSAGTEPEGGVNFAIFGDMGTGEEDNTLAFGVGGFGHLEWNVQMPAINTTSLIESFLGDLDLVFHNGDLSYAVGYLSDWDRFFDMIEPVAASVPWMVSMGNHERDYPKSGGMYSSRDSGGECGIPTLAYFPMPGGGWKPDNKQEKAVVTDSPWYSFDYGPIHVTVMSTEHDYSPGSQQHTFITCDLLGGTTGVDAADAVCGNEDTSPLNRSRTPFVLFFGHRPMYINTTWPPDMNDAQKMRDALEGVLVKAEVDMAIWGHHHSYQRSCPVINGTCVPPSPVGGYTAPVHVVAGMGGGSLMNNFPPSRTWSWLEVLDDVNFGFLHLHANQTSMVVQYLIDGGDRVRDTFTFYSHS